MAAIALVLVVFSVGLARSEQNVKNATAAGSFVYTPPDYASMTQDYGGYNLPWYGFGYHNDILINTHVCTLDASYAVYTYYGYRKNKRRPYILECRDSKHDACRTCCRQAARLDGFKEEDIEGLLLKLDDEVQCACCAPYRPFEKVWAVPVKPLHFQPYQQQLYQGEQKPSGDRQESAGPKQQTKSDSPTTGPSG